ncbi:non-ribosomal peptide synthetase [Nonomuraea soli]|uniref:Amino acid adenylation domain-containing protein n=1 Tax=Nonomuraea soli TaxID=1032476 RepID=A0A7W0CHU4_9ACTN|nr:non-ribosomal peptide synthetase [Nonomuraea soli]MBA2891471.1 amino acid adenylation domain-containing protein [Nonomuraea soli]
MRGPARMSETFAARIAQLPPEQRRLLLERLARERRPRAPRTGGPLALSFAQERLWFLWSTAPDSPAYNAPAALRLRGPLDVEALGRAIDGVVARHEILRTRYVVEGGVPAQVVGDAAPVGLPVVPATERELDRLVDQECTVPFDLERGPVLRARVFRLAPDDHVLLLVVHHIACDGWSLPILWRELDALYRGQELPALETQYADHAHRLRSEPGDDGLGYWAGHLDGLEELNLPLDRTRPLEPAHQAQLVPVQVPGRSAGRLRELARQNGVTPFMVLLAAVQALLSRVTGQHDIAVGAPTAGRDRPDIAPLIGFFVNTIVVRTSTAADPTFRELLARTRANVLDAFAHQDTPFERVVERLNPVREPGRNPLFDVMVTGDSDASGARPAFGGLDVEPYPCDGGGALFDLTFSLDDSYAGTLEYDAALFDLATVERLADQLVALLVQAADDPDLRISEYELLTEAERRQLARWNSTRLALDPKTGVEAHFESFADAVPDDPAVACGAERLTYGQVEERANRLAHLLIELGAGVDDVVAVCVDRGADAVIAPLAALKAGAAFFPVDPDQPEDRLAAMFAGAGPAVVLTGSGFGTAIPAGPWRVADVADAARQPAHRPERPSSPDALAYVIHTSGSTGLPKGVMVTRRGLANLRADWAARKITAGRWLTVASPSFDVFWGDVVRSLAFGGSLVIAPRAMALDPAELSGALAEERIEAFDSIPAVLHSLAGHVAATGLDLPDLRLLVSGGDALPVADCDALMETFGPRVRVLNAWGATETTIDSTIQEARRGSRTVSGIVPVGSAAANTTVHVLDERGRQVPIGVVGELYVGGLGVARGYAGQPAATAWSFVPDPFAVAPGSRLYRTGDRGRRLPDGSIEFLGRDDDQVKIRGHRVEPGEVRAVLRTHPAVAECHVLAWPDGRDHRLVGYAVPGGDADPAELRDFCNERMPRSMWLTAVVLVEELPRTLSGKIDRSRLPDPGTPGRRTAYEAPRTELERAVAGIWRSVLDLGDTEIGAHDDFFDLGGHSMLATRLRFALHQELGADLPVTAVFEAPTVATLAARIAGAARPDAAIERASREGPLPLSFAQERLWFLWKLAPGSTAYNMPVSVRLRGPLDRDALARALGGIVARHEILRTRYVEADGKPLQVVDPPAPVELGDAAPGEPFDLERGPVMRAGLYRESADEHVLLLLFHHIACDGWSLPVLWDELAALYQGHDLPPLEVQYADHAAHQRSATGDGGLEHWTARLAGLEPLDLPADRPRPHTPAERGDHVLMDLPADGIDRLAREHGVTVYMVLLAAVQALLSRVTGQHDVAVGTPTTGRDHPATEPLIGFFVNTLVLRGDLSGGPDFTELLRRTKESVLEAFEHQDTPFDRIVERLNPVRVPGRNPLFNVLVTYSKDERRDLWTLPGLDVERLDVQVPTAQFDLTFAVHENDTGLHGALHYACELFDRPTAEAMAARLARLLRAAIAAPGEPVARLPLLSAGERALAEGPSRDNEPALLPQVFAAHARRTPDAPAVACGAATWTYAELDREANRIAHHLIARGAGPENVVALALPRSAELIAAILAVLKTGAAYLPLDLTHPRERIASMLRDAGPRLLLTCRSAGVPYGDSLMLEELDGGPEHDPGTPLTPGTAAYVCYTSGSTGTPKGVVLEHRGLANLAANLGERLDAEGGPAHRVLQLVSPGFDVMVSELATAFTRGGCLVIAPSVLTGEELGGFLREQRVSLAHMPPAILATVPRVPYPDLRMLVVGGEGCPAGLMEWWSAGRTMINAYGPTEVTVDVSAWRCEPGTILVGRPLPRIQAHLLDAALQPVPPGSRGELYVGGPGVGRGYLGRPGLTAARFVAWHDGTRLYRTGDLARRLPGGELEFLGRADDQIKLRGHRIEPAEIEHTLGRAPGVTAAAVILRDDRLIAYIVPASANPAAVLSHARTQLPTHLLPAAILPLAALPLTPNGKLDKAALPEPPATKHRPARTPREETLLRLFNDTLNATHLGIDDDFFANGGHSILATRLISRIRGALGATLTIRDLFDHPTVAGLADMLREDARPALRPAAGAERLPLSFTQRRLWFLNRLEDAGDHAQNTLTGLRLRGPLDATALAAALTDVVARHEPLRTIFPEDAGGPYQQILAPAPIGLDPEPVTEGELPELMTGIAAQGFDLTSQTPLRARLFRLTPDEHVLLVVVHHIACDGWSMAPLSRDLAEAYRARLENREPAWRPLPVRYADFALWQDSGDDHLDFWRTTLADLPDQLELPTDRPRPAIAGYHGDTVPFTIPAAVHERMAEVARANGVSLFMVTQAALAALLTRLGAGGDVPIGTAVAGRTDESLDDLVGCFINTLVLRTDTSGDPTFAELLARVRHANLAAYEHQETPFERVVEAVNPTRTLARFPLFQVLLVFQNNAAADLTFPGVETAHEPVAHGTADYDLTLDVIERYDDCGRPEGMDAYLEYAVDLFDRSTAESMADRLLRLLEAAVEEPGTRIGALQVLTFDELDLELTRSRGPRAEPLTVTLPTCFEQQVARIPDEIAVVSGAVRWSYAELNRRANRIAHHLRAQGAGPETLVALALPRSAEMIAAVLGVHKAGAAYLPLDLEHPAERIAYTLDDARPLLVLTTRESAVPYEKVVFLEDVPDAPDHDPGTPPRPEHAAYVIYTSGSSGRPKGVVLEHGGLAHLLNAHRNGLFLAARGERLRIGFVVPLTFDTSWDSMLWLMDGHELHVIDDVTRRTPEDLVDYIDAHGIGFVDLTPVFMEQLVTAGLFAPGRHHPKALMVGGEAVSAGLWQAMLDAPATDSYNYYGQTECTNDSTGYRVRDGEIPLIGRPLVNTEVLLLDDNLLPVPPGVRGELYIGGPGVGRGYLNRPGLTAQRFVAAPGGRRLYRTGDQARRRADGALEFVGRSDNQVKLRGHRIEPAEIENTLGRAPGVAQAAVIVRDDQLVAYVTPEHVDPAELHRHALAHLPTHMLPAAYLPLPVLPLNANGKLDRRALPEPPRAGHRPPRTPREHTVLGLFTEVLERPGLGVNDNFFSAGGHSILAARLISRVRSTLGASLSIRDLFAAPTVAELVDRLAGDGAADDPFDALLPLRTAGSLPPLFCVHPVGGVSWCYSSLLPYVEPDRPVYGLQSTGPDQPSSVHEMAERYLEIIRRVQPEGPYHLLGWSFGGLVAHAMAERLPGQVGLLALLDSYPAFSGAERPGIEDAAEARTLLMDSVGYAADLDEELVATMTETVLHNSKLLDAHRPGRYEGDALLFVATRTWEAGLSADGIWAPHVAGLAVHEIDCDHDAMARAEAMALIWPIVARDRLEA